MKKILVLTILLVVLVTGCFALVACRPDADYVIGIIQPQEHVALSNARTSFQDELTKLIENDGKTVHFDYQNANNDASMIGTMIDKFVNAKYDMIYAIATPAAQVAADKTVENKIPVLFNAVTDAASANIIEDNNAPGANVTGVSDMNPMEEQVSLMQLLMGGGTDFKVGIMYSTNEDNSKIQKDTIESICAERGIETVSVGVMDYNEIDGKLASLKNSGADIVYLPTDNMLAENATTVNDCNIENGYMLPIVCGEGGMNDACGVATVSVDYKELGKIAAQMAYEILVEGKDPSTMAVRYQTEGIKYSINTKVAGEIGFDIPDSVIELAQ